MTTINEINTTIISGVFSNDQLNSIIAAVKFARGQLSKVNKNQFTVGKQVKFVSSRDGRVHVGSVVKVNRKFVIVDSYSVRWRVPACMLESV